MQSLANLSEHLRDPKPINSISAFLEIGGLWAAFTVLSTFIIAALVMSIRNDELGAIKKEKLHLTISKVAEHIERSEVSEMPPLSDRKIQRLIEEITSKDNAIRSLEVLDINGNSIFSSDRGAIAERAPEIWLESAARTNGGRHWSLNNPDEVILGITVHGRGGEASGYIVATTKGIGFSKYHEHWTSWFGLFSLWLVGIPILLIWSSCALNSEYTLSTCMEGIKRMEQAKRRIDFAATAIDTIHLPLK